MVDRSLALLADAGTWTDVAEMVLALMRCGSAHARHSEQDVGYFV